MHLLWTLLIGLIVGFVAKLLMPGKIAIGIAGSIVATYLGRMLGLYAEGASAGFIMSVIGAMILLFLYHKLFGPSSS